MIYFCEIIWPNIVFNFSTFFLVHTCIEFYLFKKKTSFDTNFINFIFLSFHHFIYYISPHVKDMYNIPCEFYSIHILMCFVFYFEILCIFFKFRPVNNSGTPEYLFHWSFVLIYLFKTVPFLRSVQYREHIWNTQEHSLAYCSVSNM